MKFRFCGDLDAPDWLLKEITVLSKIVMKIYLNIQHFSNFFFFDLSFKSVVRIRLLCKELISFLSGGPIDVKKFFFSLVSKFLFF